MAFLHLCLMALLMAVGMVWKVGWSLVLGFLISASLQTLVSRGHIMRILKGDGLRPIAIATGLGIASSSCSYAAASVSRTLFKKGAGLVPSLAFLFASTNLVIELGIVLYLLLGWQFLLGEWVGGIVLIAVMSLLVKLTYPKALVEQARGQQSSDDEGSMSDKSLRAKLRDPATPVLIAQHFMNDWRMLWKDMVLGFLIAGVLAVFVPTSVWQALFITGASPWIQVPANALLGPLVAVLTFVCSIGNVPMAAVLWGAGVSFGGVLAFLYADLIIIPLLDVYRRYYGWKMMAYMAGIFYATMALSGIIMDLAFQAMHLIPTLRPIQAPMAGFKLDYTAWLNGIAAIILVCLFGVAHRSKVKLDSCCHAHPPAPSLKSQQISVEK